MHPSSFPAESVPDGNVWFPHHFVIGVLGALFVVWLLTSDEDKPWLAVGGLLVSVYGWYHVWPSLPITGASLVIVGLMAATVALGTQLWQNHDWTMDDERPDGPAGKGTAPDGGRIVQSGMPASDTNQRLRLLAIVFLLIAWDDVFSHAFGVHTLLDRVWDVLLSPILI